MLLTVLSYAPNFVKNLCRKEEGATLVEYGLLVALIAVVCIAAVSFLGGNISTMFSSVGTTTAGT
jgi:pilus assembly protein Flp/PilA